MKKHFHFFLGALFQVSFATAQTHFTYTANTGNNATIAVPVSASPNINGTPLSVGDEIGVFTPAGLCVGAVVWQGSNTAITVWGDNDQTSEIDGIGVGEQIHYRVWQRSSNTEFAQVSVTYSQGNGIYAVNGIYVLASLIVTVTNVDPGEQPLPSTFHLFQNYPNPFNPLTVIRYQLPVSSRVRLRVFNILGEEVAELVNGEQQPGYYSAEWSVGVASGIYFYRIEALAVGEQGRRFVETKKMLIVR